MTAAKRSAESCTYCVDRSSLVATDRSLVVDGEGNDAGCSINLMFAASGGDSVEIFHCCDDDCEILAINGVLDSKLLVRLIVQVIEDGVITLRVRDTDENVPSRSIVPPKLEVLGSTKSA